MPMVKAKKAFLGALLLVWGLAWGSAAHTRAAQGAQVEATSTSGANRVFRKCGRWPFPGSLAEQLKQLESVPSLRSWSRRTLQVLHKLKAIDVSAPAAGAHLTQLERLAAQSTSLAADLKDRQTEQRLKQMGFALTRRVAIWCAIHRVVVAGGSRAGFQPAQSPAAGQVENLSYGQAESAADARHRRQISQLLTDIEQLEQSHDVAAQRRIASAYELLRSSSLAPQQQLAQKLAVCYRNANLRMAVHQKLLERLLPQPSSISTPIQESILGAEVSGNSQVQARLSLEMIPDSNRLAVTIKAAGQVHAATTAVKGGAQLVSDGQGWFDAQKVIFLDKKGIGLTPAQARAGNKTQVKEIKTNLDGTPLVGTVAKSLVRKKHVDQKEMIEREVDQRIARTAEKQLDEQAHRQIAAAREMFIRDVLAPLKRLDLLPTPTDLETTPQRLLAQIRLAGQFQGGAHTLRPLAPADSWASLQVHQSAVNNLAQRLPLDGRQGKLAEIFSQLQAAWNPSSRDKAEDPPALEPPRPQMNTQAYSKTLQETTIRFADRQAVSVQFAEGRVRLTLRLAHLEHGRRFVENLSVRVHLYPQIENRHPVLARRGVIELRCEDGRLTFGEQIALRGVFSKVFSQSRTFPLIPQHLEQDPRLADAQLTQYIIHNGWVALALGKRGQPIQASDGVWHHSYPPAKAR